MKHYLKQLAFVAALGLTYELGRRVAHVDVEDLQRAANHVKHALSGLRRRVLRRRRPTDQVDL